MAGRSPRLPPSGLMLGSCCPEASVCSSTKSSTISALESYTQVPSCIYTFVTCFVFLFTHNCVLEISHLHYCFIFCCMNNQYLPISPTRDLFFFSFWLLFRYNKSASANKLCEHAQGHPRGAAQSAIAASFWELEQSRLLRKLPNCSPTWF